MKILILSANFSVNLHHIEGPTIQVGVFIKLKEVWLNPFLVKFIKKGIPLELSLLFCMRKIFVQRNIALKEEDDEEPSSFIIRFFIKNSYNPDKFLKINNFYAKIRIVHNYGS